MIEAGGVVLDPLSVSIGRAIRTARQQAGLSMRTLARGCGVSQPFLSAVERGTATPSIATLYRISAALELPPSALLPSAGPGDVHVVRADEGRQVRSTEGDDSAVGRLVLADERKGIEVYEYRVDASDILDVWYQHDGEKVLHVIAGRLAIELEHHATEVLGPGDTIVHPGDIAHRWRVDGDDAVHLLLVIVRPPAAA